MFRTWRTGALITAMILTGIILNATAAPVASAQSTTAFTGEYYNNINLSGSPLLVRDDPAINFDWGTGAPAPGLPSDNFSVRWRRWYYVNAAGNYSFTMTSDDGSRLWVDGSLVLDMWWDHSPLTRVASLNLTQGWHLLRMEYYEHTGGAVAQLTIASAATYPDWKGEYFSNQTLSGSPTVTVNDAAINFNWGSGSPYPTIPPDHFSVRWTRNQYLNAGTYRFTATTDDGMRVWVGTTLLIDQWRDQPPTNYTADITLPAGTYPLRVEYYEDMGGAVAMLSWAPVPAANVWRGQYFANPNLSGNPVFTRNDGNLNFNWGTSGPGGGIPGTNFSVRWDSARLAPSAGFYTVSATVDDGLRVWVDGRLILNQWRDQPPTDFAATVYLTAGLHNWRVEYYQHLGGAMLVLRITPGVNPPPPTTAGDVIVDDGDSGWLAGGKASSWRHANGYNGDSTWTFNDTVNQPGYNWGRWYPSLSRAGNYEVLVYIPGGVATTQSARYWIAHAGTYTLRTVAQARYSNQWVSLGTHYFSAAGAEYVSLSDITYECYLCNTVVWDAAKFSPR